MGARGRTPGAGDPSDLPLSELVSGQKLGRFQVLGELGTGGMGVVYAAYDPECDRVVALKTLRGFNSDGVAFPASLYAFKREFRALADLAHPNLVQLYELSCDDNCWFFTMEAVRGVDPLTYLRTGALRVDATGNPFRGPPDGPPTPTPLVTPGQYARLREILQQVSRGLIALHRAGMVHRDIKPSNISVTPEGRAVVLDFGLITEFANPRASSDVTVVGTAAYMAPEQAAGEQVGPEADWYSVGVLLYEAITGQWPFEGAPIRMLMQKQEVDGRRPGLLVPDAPQDLDALCVALLRREARRRPSGEEVLRGLGGDGTISIRDIGPVSDSSGSPPFVGRGAELRELHRAFEESHGQMPIAVVVRGDAGIGKTTLVHKFLDALRSESRGVVTLCGRCHEREQVPYKAFDGIVDALTRFLKQLDPIEAALLLPDDAPLLARLFPVLRRVPVVARMPGQTQLASNLPGQRARAFVALRELLLRMRRRWPIAVFVDDLQWADADSVALLGELLDPTSAPGILLVATVRAEEGKEMPAALRDGLTEQGYVRSLELGPLSREESVHLAHLLYKRITANHAADRLAQRIAEEAAGQPLFIDELVRYIGEVGDHAELRLDEALWARIQAQDQEARRLLEVVAVGGFPMRLETVAAAAELVSQDWSKWASILRIANLVRTTGSRAKDTVEPYHDRVREAVLRHLSSKRRRQLHRRIADELQATGAANSDPHLLIRHLEAAGDTHKAAELAVEAADRARQALAFERCAALYRVLLRLGVLSQPEQTDLKLQMAHALTNAGRGVEAADVFLEVAQQADRATRLECQRLAAEQLLFGGHVERGFQVLAAVLSDAGVRLPESPGNALWSLLWQRGKLRARGLRWQQRQESEVAPRELRRLDVYATVATSMAMVDNIRGADFHARALLLALRIGEPARVVQSLAIESMLLGSQGNGARRRARKLIAEVVRVGESSSDVRLRAWAEAARAFDHYFSGRFRLAAARLGEAERSLFELGLQSLYTSTVQLFRLFALHFLGRHREMRRAFEEYRSAAERRGDLYSASTLTRACIRVWLFENDPDRARQELAGNLWTPPSQGFHLQHWYQLRAQVEVDLYALAQPSLDEYEGSFRALERSKLLRIQVVRSEFAWLCGRIALATTAYSVDSRRLLRFVARMARKLEREQVCYAAVWSELLKAGASAARGQCDASVRHLRQAVELAEQHDLMLLRAVSLRRLAETIGGEEGERWMRKAEEWMAREGVRNPERMTAMLAPGFARF
jgi:serine/threonine protein kinase